MNGLLVHSSLRVVELSGPLWNMYCSQVVFLKNSNIPPITDDRNLI